MKIVLNELPITDPPRAVLTCTAVITPTNSSNDTPARLATDPARLIPSIKSLSETAAATAAADNLLSITLLESPDLLKEFIAAVKPETASVAPRPDTRVNIIESANLFWTSVASKP